MAWVLINKPHTQKATRALAKKFAEMDPAPHDRALSERRMQVYEKLYNQGQFRPVTWASVFCIETNQTYRANGKHTSNMLVNVKEIGEFFVTVEEYRCDTLEDVARLYATFDSKMMSRTSNDITLSFAATIPALAEIQGAEQLA